MSSDPLGPQLLLQLVLILLNAFFAATEIALISLNDNKLRRQAESGDKKATQMLKIVQEPTAFLSTIQIGITLAGFLGSAFAAGNFAGRLTYFLTNELKITFVTEAFIHTVSVVLITVILSFFTLVFGELVPKRVAMQKSEIVARYASGIITVLTKASRPVIWILSAVTNGMLRLFHIDPNESNENVSEEEILYMVDVGEEKGAIEASEKEMIANIFEFNNMTAEDVMVHRTDMEVVHIDDTEEEILDKIRLSGYSRLPMCGEEMDDILGILMARDFLLNMQSREKKPFGDILRPAYFVPESVRADVLFRNMQNNKTHIAIVVDEYGGVSGLVTIEDLLEEIVGNIYDESDVLDDGEIVPIGEGVWRVAGSAPLATVSEELNVPLPESDEFDTLSGLVMDHLGAVPEDGASPEINVYGLNIHVEQMKDRRVEFAIVSKIPSLI